MTLQAARSRDWSSELGRGILVALCLVCSCRPVAAESGDLDVYTIRITALWWSFQPTGYAGTTALGRFDLRQDFGFQRSSTFTGTLDWRFARKHHFILAGTPTSISHDVAIPRTITFRGVTFPAGTRTRADIDWTSIAPGYQYDVVRRDQGYFGIGAQVFILDPSAMVTGTVTVNGQTFTRVASDSALVALPTVGPRFRFYPVPGSSRLALDGFIEGMYFGRYGDFWNARGTVHVGLIRNGQLERFGRAIERGWTGVWAGAVVVNREHQPAAARGASSAERTRWQRISCVKGFWMIWVRGSEMNSLCARESPV
jgi:hypothetical protein